MLISDNSQVRKNYFLTNRLSVEMVKDRFQCWVCTEQPRELVMRIETIITDGYWHKTLSTETHMPQLTVWPQINLLLNISLFAIYPTRNPNVYLR